MAITQDRAKEEQEKEKTKKGTAKGNKKKKRVIEEIKIRSSDGDKELERSEATDIKMAETTEPAKEKTHEQAICGKSREAFLSQRCMIDGLEF